MSFPQRKIAYMNQQPVNLFWIEFITKKVFLWSTFKFMMTATQISDHRSRGIYF